MTRVATKNNTIIPIPVVLENDAEKLSGFILRINLLGLMVELEKITFKVGAFLTAVFDLGDGVVITERVRSVKHYKDFYRSRVKNPKESEPLAAPKLLCEVHFHLPRETTRVAISKFLIKNKNKAILIK